MELLLSCAQTLRHANAGVLHTTNMHKARFADVQDTEQKSCYVRDEKEHFFKSVSQRPSRRKAVPSHQIVLIFDSFIPAHNIQKLN